MRDNLIQYVNLLFAGTSDTDEIRLEILQNTLDRFDDLISQGKSPEAAYSLAISGIGDISEILGSCSASRPPVTPMQTSAMAPASALQWKKYLRAGGVFLYIICAIPLFVLSELGLNTLGLCATIAIAGLATALVILSGDGKEKENSDSKPTSATPSRETPRQELCRVIKKFINAIGLVTYFILSFATGAWHITWLIFPIEAAITGLVNACLDLKEDN